MIFKDINSLLLDFIDSKIDKDKNCIIILDNLQLENSNILESLFPVLILKYHFSTRTRNTNRYL